MLVEHNKVGSYAGINVPGIRAIYLIDRRNVITVRDYYRNPPAGKPLCWVPAGSIVLSQGAEVYSFAFPPLAASLTVAQDRGAGGRVYVPSVAFAVPRTSLDMQNWLDEHGNKEFVVIAEDANLNAYLLGNEERGLKLNYSNQISSPNNTPVNLSSRLIVPLLVVETGDSGFVLANQFAESDFGIGFSLDFNI